MNLDSYLLDIAKEFLDQMKFSRDLYGPCIIESNPEYRNNLELWLKKFHPELLDKHIDISMHLHTIWPVVKIPGTDKYKFSDRYRTVARAVAILEQADKIHNTEV